MVGGARSATHFIVSPSAWHPPHMHTHTQCTSTHTGCMGAHTHTHIRGLHPHKHKQILHQPSLHRGLTSTYVPVTHIKVKVVGSCGHTCGSMRGKKCEKTLCCFFSFFDFQTFFFFFFKKLPRGFITETFDRRSRLYRQRATHLPNHSAVWAVCKGQKRNQFHPDKCK